LGNPAQNFSAVAGGRTSATRVRFWRFGRVKAGVPAPREAGYPDLTFEGTVGIYGWRDLPQDIPQSAR